MLNVTVHSWLRAGDARAIQEHPHWVLLSIDSQVSTGHAIDMAGERLQL